MESSVKFIKHEKQSATVYSSLILTDRTNNEINQSSCRYGKLKELAGKLAKNGFHKRYKSEIETKENSETIKNKKENFKIKLSQINIRHGKDSGKSKLNKNAEILMLSGNSNIAKIKCGISHKWSLKNIYEELHLNEKRKKEMLEVHNYLKQQWKIKQPSRTEVWFYKIGKLLGKGAFGKVNLGIHKLTGKLVAIKFISKEAMADTESREKVMREVSIWDKLQHPSIIQLYETFESRKYLLYVNEFCPGGDLLTYVRKRRKLKEVVAKYILKQILDALYHCHSKSILHRDIKLDNILLNANGLVKVVLQFKIDM